MTFIPGMNGVRRLDANLYGFQRVQSIADGDPLAVHPFYRAHSSFTAAGMSRPRTFLRSSVLGTNAQTDRAPPSSRRFPHWCWSNVPLRIDLACSQGATPMTALGALQPVADHAAYGRRCP